MTVDELQSRMDDIIRAVAELAFTDPYQMKHLNKMHLVSGIYENYTAINEACILKDIKVVEEEY